MFSEESACLLQYFFLKDGFRNADLVTNSTEPLLGNILVLVVCVRLCFFPKNCCDLAWPIQFQYIFFTLLTIQFAFSGPLQFCRVIFCYSYYSNDTGGCITFTSLLDRLPYLTSIFCSGLMHFWVSAAWSNCFARVRVCCCDRGRKPSLTSHGIRDSTSLY